MLWEATLQRARLLPEAELHEQVNGEWSFGETQRHLLLAGDAWLGNAVLEEEAPYHPWGLPAGGVPPDAMAKLGLIPDATPTLDDVLGSLTRAPSFDPVTRDASGGPREWVGSYSATECSCRAASAIDPDIEG